MKQEQQPEALRLADTLDLAPENGIEPQTAEDAAAELRRQHARIAELEAQLEAIGAGGVSGPLMGCASIAASVGSEPVAWLVFTEEGDPSMVFLSQREAQQYLEVDERPIPLYTNPSPPEGMVGGWQDIATAPKDGTYLLLWEKYSTNPFVGCWAFDSWSVSHEHVDAEGGWDGANVVDSISQDRITHWMHLPLPPTTSAGSVKGGEA